MAQSPSPLLSHLPPQTSQTRSTQRRHSALQPCAPTPAPMNIEGQLAYTVKEILDSWWSCSIWLTGRTMDLKKGVRSQPRTYSSLYYVVDLCMPPQSPRSTAYSLCLVTIKYWTLGQFTPFICLQMLVQCPAYHPLIQNLHTDSDNKSQHGNVYMAPILLI